MLMKRWARGFLILGACLTGLAILPALLQLTIVPQLSPIFSALALYSIGPIGVLCLALSLIFFVVWLIQR